MRHNPFGSSGIRGLANKEITPDLAVKIGEAIASMYSGGTVVVGRDSRITGPMLEAALCSGLKACGVDVIIAGIIPTPVVAWSVTDGKYCSGVEITASHNPPDYNGFKIFNNKGMSFTSIEQRTLTDLLDEKNYNMAEWREFGSAYEVDIGKNYLMKLTDFINVIKSWRIACDCYCGATSTIAPKAFKELGVSAELINAQPDGLFPAGNPEPNIETLTRLGRFVSNSELDIGFGFDGDGDRMVPVNENGAAVNSDRLLASYASHVIEKNGGGVIVTHVGTSMCIDEMVEEAGGQVERTRVGDSFISQTMKKYNAIFGGEPVGAWIHPTIHMCPDGILSALKLLEALEEEDLQLSQFVERAPNYPIIRSKISCPKKDKKQIMSLIIEKFEKVFENIQSVNNIDGIRLQMENGWILIRPSGTEPILRLTTEGKTLNIAEKLMKKGRKLVEGIMEGEY